MNDLKTICTKCLKGKKRVYSQKRVMAVGFPVTALTPSGFLEHSASLMSLRTMTSVRSAKSKSFTPHDTSFNSHLLRLSQPSYDSRVYPLYLESKALHLVRVSQPLRDTHTRVHVCTRSIVSSKYVVRRVDTLFEMISKHNVEHRDPYQSEPLMSPT